MDGKVTVFTVAKFRQQKIDEEIKRELSYIIPTLKDPRLSGIMVSVVAVEVTRDLKYAKAHISVMNSEKADDAIKALSSSAGFIRRELGMRIRIRYTPELTFVRDTSIEYGAHINDILKNL